MEELWGIVDKIVSSRGRKLIKYHYFEDVWHILLNDIGLGVVRAPTGCGKTEAATAMFLRGLANGSRPWLSMIYALPTRSLALAMQHRLCNALEALSIDWCTVTLDYGELFMVKPYLAGDVVVTTYDTLLYQFYGIVRRGYHVLMPMSKVSSSLVIMDEVQLLQDESWYAMSLLPYHICSLLQLGAKVLLLSATIPSLLLEEIHRVIRSQRLKLRQVWDEQLKTVDSHDEASRGNLSVELREHELPSGKGLLEVLRDLEIEERLPALIVVNSVKKAVKVYEDLIQFKREGKLEEAIPLLLHSRLRLRARHDVESVFETSTPSLDPEKILLVATQVVEAGLDLDIRLMLTEVSPIDSLIQRLGRCGRRRDGLAIIFLDPEAGRHIYPEHILRRTLEHIRGMERELALSVRSLGPAQELVDDVYIREEVEKLRMKSRALIHRATAWIRVAVDRMFSRLGHGTSSPLLRLGQELICWRAPDRSYYDALTRGMKVEISVKEFRDNVVRLSIRSPNEILPAVMHKIGDRDTLVELKIEHIDKGLEVSATMLKPLNPPSNRRFVLLLNPDYYELKDGVELGVVDPWHKR